MDNELEPIVDGEATVPETAPPPSSRRRRMVPAAAAAGVLAVAVGAVAVLAGGGPRSPERQLQALRAFVAQRDTVHFVAIDESETTPLGDGLGDGSTSRSRTVGDLVFPAKGHWETDDGNFKTETIVTDQGSWTNDNDFGSAGDEPQPWVFNPPLDDKSSDGGWFGYAPATGAGFTSITSEPGLPWGTGSGLRELLGRVKSPERVSDNVIRARMSLREMLGDLPGWLDAGDLPDGTVTLELTSGPGGRLDRMRYTVDSTDEYTSEDDDGNETTERERTVDSTDVRFSRWDEPVTLTPPPASEVDPTPSIDEEALSHLSFPVLVPRTLPAGMMLESASGPYNGEDGVTETGRCPSVDLWWVGGSWAERATAGPDADFDHMSLRAFKDGPGCAELGFDGFGLYGPERPFVAGDRRGTIIDSKAEDDPEDSGLRTVTLKVDGTTLEFSSGLSEAELATMLADLVPLDLATQPVLRQEPPAE